VVPVTSFLRNLFQWIDWESGRPRLTGQIFEELYNSRLDIVNEDSWHFNRPLGKGGFGCAAIYKKFQFGQLADALLIKEAGHQPQDKIHEHLSREAVIMAQTNELHSQEFPRLRAFKNFIDQQQNRYHL
jgi:hypothetical protein